jgi:hypothetical protein
MRYVYTLCTAFFILCILGAMVYDLDSQMSSNSTVQLYILLAAFEVP